jgi:Na+-transporting methylmalonyl-CoA/oxaloacetate decarboxylase gamma subunit
MSTATLNSLAMWDIPNGDFLQGLLMSVFCIAVVFIILTIITLILMGVNKIRALDVKETVKMKDGTELDEEAMAAVLVATLDYRKEKKEDVKVISCKLIADEKADKKKKKN